MHDDYPQEAGNSRKLDRKAIWNREKIIFLIAMGVWVADVIFLIDSEYLLAIIGVFLANPWYHRFHTGKMFSVDCLDMLGLFDNHSSVIRGRMRATPASCSTQIA